MSRAVGLGPVYGPMDRPGRGDRRLRASQRRGARLGAYGGARGLAGARRWEPLCDALGMAVPGEPFPHLNTREEFPHVDADTNLEEALEQFNPGG